MSTDLTRRSSRTAIEHHYSSGGLVARNDEVLLISTRGGRRWQIPKGHVEEGESAEQAAVREVREETGVSGNVLVPLPGIDYSYLEQGVRRIRKHVDYFLLGYERGSEADYDPREVDGARWFPIAEAVVRLSFANERRVAVRALEVLRLRALEPGDVSAGRKEAS